MSFHPELERLVRSWAKDVQAAEQEVVFEAPLEDRVVASLVIASKLCEHSDVWLLFYSIKMGEAEIVPASRIQKSIFDACCEHRMVSLVDPLSGGGLTIDVSDEGGGVPTLQVTGWGACDQLVTEIGKQIPGVYWIR